MAQPVRRDQRRWRVGVRQDDRELVAAGAERAVAVAERVADRVRHAEQELVAGGVALAVVDDLEVVEVDEQEGDRDLVAPEEVELAVELLLERAVVPEAGQPVVERVLARLAVEDLELRLRLGKAVERAQERPRDDDRDDEHADRERHDRDAERGLAGGHRRRPELDEAEMGAVGRAPERSRGRDPAGRLEVTRGARVAREDAVDADAKVAERARSGAPVSRFHRGPSGLGDDLARLGVDEQRRARTRRGRRGRLEELAQSDLDREDAGLAAGARDELGREVEPVRAVGGRCGRPGDASGLERERARRERSRPARAAGRAVRRPRRGA